MTSQTPLQGALDVAVTRHHLEPADARLCSELCFGYFRLKLRIDFFLDYFLPKRAGLPLPLQCILGLAVYEILYLDKVPIYASVDFAVSAAKALFNASLANLANAVLRKLSVLPPEHFSRTCLQAALPDQPHFFSVYYSCPLWIVHTLLAERGPLDTEALLQRLLLQPPLGLRIRPEFLDHPLALACRDKDALYLPEVPLGFASSTIKRPEIHEALSSGVLSQQSLASQQAVAMALPLSWPSPRVDVCSGRGGKTFLLFEQGITLAGACDLNRRKICDAKREAARLHQDGSIFFQADACALPFTENTLGAVLLDAPCTGLGVASRRPDIKYRRTPRDLAALAALQSTMLTHAFSRLRKGGRLAYMTCTLFAAENGCQTRSLLQSSPDADLIQEWSTPADSPLNEFFYVALLRKK